MARITTPGSAVSTGLIQVDRGVVAASTNYNPGDIVVYRGRRILITTAVTSGTGATPFISSAAYIALGPESSIYAWDYGFRADGNQATAAANDTALANAVAAASALGAPGCSVILPYGQGYISATIELKYGVWLVGQGVYGTYLRLKDAANVDMVRNHVSTGSGDANAPFVGCVRMTLDGNKANQTTGGHGVVFATNPLTTQQGGTGGVTPEQFDMHHVLEDLRVRQCFADGVHLTGRSAIQLKNVHSASNNGYGFFSTFDTNFTHCEADGNGKSGFYLNNGSIRAAVCKSYLSGQVDGVGAGFEFGSNCNGGNLAACEAQNNAGQGFYLNGCGSVNVHGVADSNSLNAVGYSGVELNAAPNCIVNVVCWQGKQGGVQVGNQSYALKITGACTGSDVKLTHAARGGATISTDLDAASVLAGTGLRVFVNGKAYTAGGTFTTGLLGDGSDGNLTFDGASAVTGATRSGTTYTLTRDLHATQVTVQAGATVVMAGYRIFCQGAFTHAGTVTADGTAGQANGTAGAATAGAVLLGGVAGGAGNTGAGTAGGNNNGSQATYAVGSGGAGGLGSSGAGGAQGFAQNSNTQFFRTPLPLISGTIGTTAGARVVGGAASGGGGGGDGTNKGGGGGSGGGIIALYANTFTSTGTLTAKGGDGGTPTTGNAGGGGGGGGGLIVVYTLAPATMGTTVVTGGAAGTAVGTGANGNAGAAGNALNVVLA